MRRVSRGVAVILAAQILGVILLAGAGVASGRRIGRISRWWWLGFLLPFAAITLVILGHRSIRLSFVAPVSWAVDPFAGPLLMALAVPAMLSTLIVRLAARRTRIMVSVLMWVMFGYYAICPVTLPLLFRSSLASIPTRIDSRGVCLQTHSYTCGPAAAVTCLAALGVKAQEGALAIAARSAPAIGTDPLLLARAVNRCDESAGVHCEYGFVGSLDRLPVPAVASIFSPQYGGHYVAVLEITPAYIIVGDPLSGRDKWSRDEFLSQWTGAALVFTRSSGASVKH